MDFQEALAICLELARENALSEREAETEPGLCEEYLRQQEALELVGQRQHQHPNRGGTMTECKEVADNLPLCKEGATLDEVRAHVRGYMPGESTVVVDNVAEALWQRGKTERREQEFYVVDVDEVARVREIAQALLNGTDRMRDLGGKLWLVLRGIEKRGTGL